MSTKIGLLRCSNNDQACPLTGCFKAMHSRAQGFAEYEETPTIMGVFTLQDSDEANAKLAKVMQAKGVEVIHLVTCAFARKEDGSWTLGNGFVDDPERLLTLFSRESGLPCVMGAAHLPKGYSPRRFQAS